MCSLNFTPIPILLNAKIPKRFFSRELLSTTSISFMSSLSISLLHHLLLLLIPLHHLKDPLYLSSNYGTPDLVMLQLPLLIMFLSLIIFQYLIKLIFHFVLLVAWVKPIVYLSLLQHLFILDPSSLFTWMCGVLF